MKTRIVGACAAVVALAISGVAAAAPAKEPVLKSFDEIQFAPMPMPKDMPAPPPGTPMPQVAPVYGDASKGAHGTLIRLPAGMVSPKHMHSAEVRGVVIAGEVAHTFDDGADKWLKPGSYFVQPAKMMHVSKCKAGAECIMMVMQDKKMDLVPDKAALEAMKAAAAGGAAPGSAAPAK